MSYQVETLLNSVELGAQFVQTAGTVVTVSDTDYQALSASAFASSTTLSASTSVGATSITTAVSIPSGTTVSIDSGTAFESATTSAVSGSGPYTLTVPALKNAHASGAKVAFGTGDLILIGQVANTGDAVSVQASHVANAAALTAPSDLGASYSQANVNALRADVAALQAKLNAVLAALQVANGPMAAS
jgi:hypothetical protein